MCRSSITLPSRSLSESSGFTYLRSEYARQKSDVPLPAAHIPELSRIENSVCCEAGAGFFTLEMRCEGKSPG